VTVKTGMPSGPDTMREQAMNTKRQTAIRSLSLATLGLGLALTGATPASAGLLEMIFGAPRPAPAPVAYAPIPDVGGDAKGPRAAGPRKVEEARPRTQTPMNIAGDPEWYLRDPTLRKGDIIVLTDKVLVYNGGGRERRDFAELGNSSLSKKDRQSVLSLTEAPREALVSYSLSPAVRPVASAGDEKTAGLDAPGPVNPVSALKNR